VLENSVIRVTKDDIYDFVIARKENVRHLDDFISTYEKEPLGNKKTIDRLKAILK